MTNADLQEETAPSTERTVSPQKLAHVVLRSRSHYAEMIDWYLAVLGAKLVYKSERISFLSYDDEHHRIAITRSDELTDRPYRSVGLDHIAFTYANLDDLLAVYARLKRQQILPFCNVNHGPTTSLYYLDPDQNRIELQVDNFADMHDATRLMQDQFDVNPVGVEFDADVWIDRLKAGERPEDLVRPSENPLPPTAELISRIRSS